ncbi:YDG/SRA domain-containing protein [Arachidicoccus terrestris]|uniref:YDG/SRA domain-containing protein n=1 Tax=Arachidicoccus terrestris TaxID=2875539 RepID=UPI001CC75245|nr:YDG/SRA domain-containing protein [Arachidicoccus terrestris]UAY55665.1 HNH endonuclease [Arachidicoccus terrestris]
MANYTFGEIDNVKEGDSFSDRKALREAGIHLALVAGIDGNQSVGASSIVLNGGYVDDLDLGSEIIYTGQGGNDANTKRQVADQKWTLGNKALLVSEMSGLPVRLTRGFNHKSEFSPKSGYVYGGLYRVTDHFEEKGKDGYTICRFRLEKINSFENSLQIGKPAVPELFTTSERVATTVLRIIRDTKLSKRVKELYDYKCQVCGIQISVKGIKYAEGAHIKPLGNPHKGEDKLGNLLCLCPNHHVMFDKGVFTIHPSEYSLIGIGGELTFDHKKHVLDQENLKYHQEHIFINH